jgi:DNA polymerase III epsilon subunit-like protein
MILVHFDTETGGVLPEHPTIQLAAVAMDDDIELGAFEQKIVFNESDCDPKALEINHYTREAWVDAKSPAVTASRFAQWLRPYCIVEKVSKAGNPYKVARLAGYNAATFDMPRLRAMFTPHFLPAEFMVRDVLQQALFYFDKYGYAPDNFKLATVANHFGIPTDGAHDALFDVRLCAAIHRKMME